MDLSLQGSLLDLTDAMTLRDVGTGKTRHPLAHGAWVDVRPGWLAAGDELFTALLRDVPWHAERRQMYDSVVAVPRLTKFYAGDETLPHPMLALARDTLSRHYAGELGEPFVTTKDSGTGLGVMVTRKIVQNHRGDISFTSQMGVGTTVTVSLPVACTDGVAV